ncbi:MAG TPA: HD-GYP domain-containing protein [Clostridia bacterium]|nr:HD-GYP domain-containing protein [Clostridia bacterium]
MYLAKTGTDCVGKRLAVDIRNAAGSVLLKAGTVLTPAYIEILLQKGYTSVYIADRPDETIEGLQSVVSVESVVRATRAVKSVADAIASGQRPNMRELLIVTDLLVDEVIHNESLIASVNQLKSLDEYTFFHSVNVCIYSLIIGCKAGLSLKELRSLSVGALLHDIGKVAVPLPILKKPGKLLPEEFEAIKFHTWKGFELTLKNLAFNTRAAHVALQHHERLDGSGYPRSLQDDEIHVFGRICAVADVFDAMTSDRSYRPAFRHHEAMAALSNLSGKELDANFVDILMRRVAHYPNGTWVKLSDGSYGCVIAQDATDSTRPVVRLACSGSIIGDPAGHPIAGKIVSKESKESQESVPSDLEAIKGLQPNDADVIELAQHPTLEIVSVLDGDPFPTLSG